MNIEIIKNVQQSFETKFGTTALTVFSPGRINLIGEHTDYNDGFVFPAAIDLGIVVAIQKTNFPHQENTFHEHNFLGASVHNVNQHKQPKCRQQGL